MDETELNSIRSTRTRASKLKWENDSPFGCNEHALRLKTKLYIRACNRELFSLYMPKYPHSLFVSMRSFFPSFLLSFILLFILDLVYLDCSWQLFTIYVRIWLSWYMVSSFIHRFSAKCVDTHMHSICHKHIHFYYLHTTTHIHTHGSMHACERD